MSILRFSTEYIADRQKSSKEEIFLEQYDWMLQSAMNLTRGKRECSQDLVHDAFVQFQLKQSVEAITDVRAYLYGMLRNLYVSQIRRVSRYPIQELWILDHDSASASLRAYDFTDQLQAMTQLTRACEYACHRKESSSTASIFILRYFHGYYPDEIARLLGTKRDKIDKWLARGRAEAKSYLAEQITLPRIRNISKIRASRVTASRAAFLKRLCAAVFESCTSPCEATGNGAVEISLGTSSLAHLVSCAFCLDQRSRKVGLPGPGERAPEDFHRRDDNRNDSGEGGQTNKRRNSVRGTRDGKNNSRESKAALLRRGYAHTQEVLCHHPFEISIAVEGYVRTSHVIQSTVTILNLTLDTKERAEFVEILSGHGIRFLLLDREDLISASPRRYRVELSDNRFLEAKVIPGIQGPCVQIEYSDPAFEVQSAQQRDFWSDWNLDADVEHQPDPRERAGLEAKPEGPSITFWWSRLIAGISRCGRLAMNPLLPMALFLGCASLLCFILWLRSAPGVTADVLLEKAEKWDPSTLSKAEPGVIHQKVRIRTSHGILERSIYRDKQGRRRIKPQELKPEEESLRINLETAGVNWEQPLSAANYKNWRDHQNNSQDSVIRKSRDLLRLTTTVKDGAVTEESLTIREHDFHPVERTIVFRDQETVEIAELSYNELPWTGASEAWFAPLSAISEHPATPVLHFPVRLTESQLDEAELEARLALNEVHADTSERIVVRRETSAIRVEGIVATEERKREINRRLRQATHIVCVLHTFNEVQSFLNTQHQTVTDRGGETAALAQNASDVDLSPLEKYLLAKGVSQEEVRRIGHDLFNASMIVSQEGTMLDSLSHRFTRERLNEHGRGNFDQLIQAHTHELLSALQVEDQLLENVGIPPPERRDGSITTNLRDASQQNASLCGELVSRNDGNGRTLSQIATELVQSTAQVRAMITQPHDSPVASEAPQ